MKLNEVCLNIVDCPHSTAPDEGSGYALIRTPNIGKGRFNLEGIHRISEEAYKKRCARITPTVNDLILAREAPAGNVAIIKENMEPLALGQRTVLIRPNPEKVNPEYLVYYLLAPKQQNELLGRATGATVAHVNIPIINNLPVSLPTLETQKKIAGILSAYDDLIENNHKQIKLLEEAAQKLYKEWFVKLNFPGHENTKIVDGVPEGWINERIGKLFKTVLGGTPSRKRKDFWENGTIPWINSGKVNELRIIEPSEYITELALNKSATKLLPKHTVLIAITGATLGQVSYTEIETCANQSVVGIIDEKEQYSSYLYCNIFTNIQSIITKATGGAQQRINKDIVDNHKLLLPSANIIELFNKSINPIFNKITILLKQNQLIQSALDKLLPKLMNGDLDV